LSLSSFLESVNRLLRLASKPGREEIWLSVKIGILGVSILGIIGFVIRFLSSMIQGFSA
jgi:protein translocase SEC61 complex gamma subunit